MCTGRPSPSQLRPLYEVREGDRRGRMDGGKVPLCKFIHLFQSSIGVCEASPGPSTDATSARNRGYWYASQPATGRVPPLGMRRGPCTNTVLLFKSWRNNWSFCKSVKTFLFFHTSLPHPVQSSFLFMRCLSSIWVFPFFRWNPSEAHFALWFFHFLGKIVFSVYKSVVFKETYLVFKTAHLLYNATIWLVLAS